MHNELQEKTQATAEARHYCDQPTPMPIALPEGIAAMRASAIILVAKKWVNSSVIHFHFLAGPTWQWPEVQKAQVRQAFARWKAVGIGLEFVETADVTEAEIRIGFDQREGSWSYVGTDALQIPPGERTMNFGWDLTTVWGQATALHEVGHAMGMSHEHQNPNSGLVWNEEAVYAAFAASPNFWPRQKTFDNIIAKLPGQTQGSAWDPQSIMHYPFDASLIAAPPPYNSSGIPESVVLSPTDIVWAQRFYPAGTATRSIGVMDLQPIAAITGGQADFTFEPLASRQYTIRTVGLSDCKIVVFIERDGVPRFLQGEDDSGTPDNAAVTAKLFKGDRYVIRVRTHFADTDSGLGLLVV